MAKKRSQQLPKRPLSHVVGDQAVVEFRKALPAKWVFREDPKDYGIDAEIEIVGDDGSVTGALVKCQIKGTGVLRQRSKDCVAVNIQTVRYWVGLPLPVVLVRVSRRPTRVRWLCAREYLLMHDLLESLYSTRRKTVIFDFSASRSLPQSARHLRKLALEQQSAVEAWHDEEEARVRGDFMGYHILVHLYDGDADRWLQWLREHGSEKQLVHDVPFVVWLKAQLAEDPTLLGRMRRMVKVSSPGSGQRGKRKRGK